MAEIHLEVVWKNNKPYADDAVVKKSQGATSIIWTAGPDVASFDIEDLDPAEFKPQNHNPDRTRWHTVDRNTTPVSERPKAYKYSISATHSDGSTAHLDPVIVNEDD